MGTMKPDDWMTLIQAIAFWAIGFGFWLFHFKPWCMMPLLFYMIYVSWGFVHIAKNGPLYLAWWLVLVVTLIYDDWRSVRLRAEETQRYYQKLLSP